MFPDPYFVETNGLDMAVYERGEGPAVVFLHGFPELAYSWRHQLPALAEAGFRAIAPDLRGYGDSDRPKAVDDYAIQKLAGDVIRGNKGRDTIRGNSGADDIHGGAQSNWQGVDLVQRRIVQLDQGLDR